VQKHRLALVMPVASFGCPVDVAGWDAFVATTGIPVLIDAAAAFGNQAIGERCAVAFSFHATKPFGIGEGGALVSRDPVFAQRVRRLSNFGYAEGQVQEAGTNSKLSEYGAAVGLAQGARWPAQQQRRRALWQAYAPLLARLPEVRLQAGYSDGDLPAALVVRLPQAAASVAKQLAAMGIETRRWYYPPLHRHSAFSRFPCCGVDDSSRLTVSEQLAETALGLPWYADLTLAQCHTVAQGLAHVLGSETVTPAAKRQHD
jgi:dTDP-4-amino-4,6-dideoxygalactose transaminase